MSTIRIFFRGTRVKTIILLLFCILTFNTVQARVDGRFIGTQFLINVVTESYDGHNDDTPGVIYKAMNVPPQNSFLGMGKAIKNPKGDLSFICTAKAQEKFQCSFIIFNNQYSKISSNQAVVEFNGEKAEALYKQFSPFDGSDEIKIIDNSGLFKLEINPSLFRMSFNTP